MPAPKLDPVLLEYELEQAWQLMRHHEGLADYAKRTLESCRDRQKREYPRVLAFNRICNIIAGLQLGVTAEAACDAIAAEIMCANQDVASITKSQEKARAEAKPGV